MRNAGLEEAQAGIKIAGRNTNNLRFADDTTLMAKNEEELKSISPGCSLEGLMLKLKLQYFGHLMRRVDSGKDFDAGRDWGQEKGMTEDEMAGWPH